MKYLLLLMLLSACATFDTELQAHLEAEREFHQYYYDQEYIADCLYYEDLVCEFEQ
jgi:hypothetical protein